MACRIPSALRSVARHATLPRAFGLHQRSFARTFSDLRFSKTHEWVKVEGDVATMGISDFAQGQLGEVVYCDLPDEGATFSGKETICTLESVKAVGEVYAPTDCEVVEVNEQLGEEPALVNGSPEADGWLVKFKVKGELDDLMDRAAYDKFLQENASAE